MDKQVIIQVKNNKANFKKFNPTLYSLKAQGLDTRNEDNYDGQGAFKLDAFLGTSRPLTPTFNLTTNRWGFFGDTTTLKELVSKCKLRHEHGDKKGKVIEPEEVDVTNRYDSFFDHSDMVIRLENGKAKLDLADPKHMFLYLCLTDDPDITNPKSNPNPFMTGHQKFEMIDINAEKAKESVGIDDTIEAYVLFKNIKNNTERLITVSRALDILKDDSKPEDPSALWLEIKNRFVENTALYPNSTKTYQQVFLETASKDTESLNRMHLVNFGIYKSIIRPRTIDGFWTMKTKTGDNKDLMGVKSKLDAYAYFQNPDNFPDLESLMNQTNLFNTVFNDSSDKTS